MLVMVNSVHIQDWVGVRLVLAKLEGAFGSLKLILVDGGYSGKLQEWLGFYRRLSKDYAARLDHSEAMILLASSRQMLKRLSN